MAVACPNTKSPEWEKLVNEFQGNRLTAMMAFVENKNQIPAIDSEIVTKLKSRTDINFGSKVKEFTGDPLNEPDYYELDDGTKIDRVGNILGISSPVAKRGSDYIRDRADLLWKDKDKQKDKIENTKTGEPETYDEYIERREYEASLGRAKGKVLHYAIEMITSPNKQEENSNKINKILEDFRDKFGQTPFYWEWILNKKESENGEVSFSNVEKILDNLGINTLKKIDDPALDLMKDKIFTEVHAVNKDIGLGGTMDLFVQHSDGTYSIVDWKTGKAFSGMSEFSDMFLMRYGQQGSKEITNNLRNRAKLQLTLYAMIMKANNPGMKFRDLQIGWIPNEHIINTRDVDAAVDVNSFVPMIKALFKDKELLKEWKIDPNIGTKLLDSDPNIFNPAHYSQHSLDNEEFNEILSGEKSPQQVLEDKLTEIRYITGKEIDINMLSLKDRNRLIKLSDDVSKMLEEGNILITKDSYHDMNWMERYLGNYSEVTHPAVQAWKAFKNKREDEANRELVAKKLKFRSLLKPVIKEVEKEFGVVNILGNKNYNYEQIYGWAYVKDKSDDETGKVRERYLTHKETDPELQKRWKELSPAKKKLLLYINKTYSSYFNTEGRYANMVVTETPKGEKLTGLDLFNFKKGETDKREYYDGFFFKVYMQNDEKIMREGDGSYLKGFFNKKTLRRMWYEKLTMFREREYENWFSNVNAMPLKYMGNDYIDTSMNYTHNLEFTFNQSVSNMERMDRLQDVYSLGLALRTKLASERDPDNPTSMIYKNLVTFLDAKLIHDVIGKSKQVSWGRTKRLRVPMYNPRTGKYENTPISVDKLLIALRSWGSAVTMWAKPFRGLGNAALAVGFVQRDAIKGSIAKLKFLGISGDVVDLTIESKTRANLEYTTDVFPKMMQGRIMDSKMYLLAKKLNYIGDNFGSMNLNRESLTKRYKWVNKDILYAPYSIPEEFVTMTTMTGTLMNLKNTTTGKSLYDSYEKYEILDENGKGTGVYDVRWTGGVRGMVKSGSGSNAHLTELTELSSREISSIKKVHERLQGNYRREEALAVEVTVMGTLFTQLKKYFPRLLLNGIHAKRIETDLGRFKIVKDDEGNNTYYDGDKKIPVLEWVARTTEGRWVTIGKMLTHLLTLGTFAKEYGWGKLNDEQKTNLIEASLTLAEWMILYGMYLTMFGEVGDDDTTKRLWKQYLVDNLTQQYNAVDLLRTVKTAGTPISVMKLVDFSMNGAKLALSTGEHITGHDDLALTTNGDLRGFNKTIKNVPLLSSFYDIRHRIEHDKSGLLNASNWLYGGVRLQ